VIEYINGQQLLPWSSKYSPLNTGRPLYLGYSPGGSLQPINFNGSISNVQVYNTVFTAGQVQQLYNEGISGQPISNSIVGWWPLNGNANDYTGNSNNDIVGAPLLYTTTAQLSAKVTNQQNYAVQNTLVGFSSTLCNFTNAPYTSVLTNSNGIAISFLNQQGKNGRASISATAFNGNNAYQGNLIGWWPMNLGEGNTVYDMSGNGNNGAMNGGAYWSIPLYVSGFDGASGYVATSYLQNSITAYTVSAWIKSTSPGGVIEEDRVANSGNSLTLGFGPSSGCGAQSSGQVYFCDESNGVGIGVNSVAVVNDGKWHMLTGTWGALSGGAVLKSQFSVYIDGQPMNTLKWSVGSDKSPLTGTGGAIIGFHPAWNEYFSGSMSNIQVYNSILSPGQVQMLYRQGIAAPPVSGNLIGWWPLDGDANDYSGYGGNGTIFGNLNPLSTSSIPNTNGNATGVLAANFNGISSYMNLPPRAFGNYPVSPASTSAYALTFTAWFQTKSNGVILGQVQGAGTLPTGSPSGFVPALYIDNNGYLRASVFWHNSQSSQIVSSRAYNDGSWHFLADSYNNGVETLYVDGVPLGSQSAAEYGYSSAYTYYLGVSYSSAAWSSTNNGWFYFNGNLINVQVYNASLNSQQIRNLYNGGMQGVPLSMNLTAWWPLSGNANDYSVDGNGGTAANVVYAPQQSVVPYLLSSISGYGVNFNGQNSFIWLPKATDIQAPLTLSAWIYPTSFGSSPGSYVISATVGVQLSISPTGYPIAEVDINGNWVGVTSSTKVPLNEWSFVATAVQGNYLYIYVNGQLTGSVSISSGSITYDSSYPYAIGAFITYSDVPNWLFMGSIANVQEYNTALTAAQIKQLYQKGMPPSASAVIPMSWEP
jgi:hypothetical protein